MRTASFTINEKPLSPYTVETVVLDGQRYEKDRVGCLKPVLTNIFFTDCLSDAWAWLQDRSGAQINYRLASYPQPGMVPAEPRQWVFEVTDKGLARFLANFGAEQVAA
jgi:hypothetical protein